MAVPKVAIVGRPNVGKSSLFNWIAGRRIAIVDPTAGVTRDRITFLFEHQGQFAELVDTGGMGNIDKDGLTADIERQIQVAIDEASLVVFVVDAQTGLVEEDLVVARRLKSFRGPILAVVNKCDTVELEREGSEFYKLGRDLVFVSVTGGRNRDRLIAAIFKAIPYEPESDSDDAIMKFAIVGKRNSGKSTFINTMARSERVIVSEVPGTTRDSVDVHFSHDGREFVAIDTAGVRRTRSLADSIEFYGYNRAQRSIRRADVVFHLMDASIPLSKVDQQLSAYIIEEAKPCILVVNKWDLVKDQASTEQFSEYIDSQLQELSYAPRVFITASTGRNTGGLIDVAQSLFKQAGERVGTGELNRIVEEAIARRSPPIRKNRRLKIYYTTQVATRPPTLIFMCNDPKLLDPSWKRYLMNWLRDRLPFHEVPIKTYFRHRDKSKREDESEPAKPDAESAD